MRKHYDKMVRDRIPEIIDADGKEAQVCQVSGLKLKEYAFKKLREEVEEFIENPCAEEAADILEILNTICDREGILPQATKAAKIAKQATRGSFDMGFVLEWVEEEW